MDSEREIIDEFINEAGEHLETVENELLVLEKQPESHDHETIAEIFRAIHSIKGAAGFLGFEKLKDLSHVMETLLDMIRKEMVLPDSEIIDVLLSGTDSLKRMFFDIDSSNDFDIEKIHGRFTELIKAISSHDPEDGIIELKKIADNSKREKKQDCDARDSVQKEREKKNDSCRNGHSETVRISVEILDQLMTLAGELVLVRNQQLSAVDKSDSGDAGISQRLDIVTSELQETIMCTRMQPIGNVFSKLPRIVRDLSRKLDKNIEIRISGNEVELDKTILESLADPLTHLIRNCCDHGIETPGFREKSGKALSGLIEIKAFHEAGQINIFIKDDGKGMDTEAIRQKAIKLGLRAEDEISGMGDKELLSLVMVPGFSTAENISDISGRGVGMDVVKTSIEKLGGSFELDSVKGEYTSVMLRLPLTLAIIPCLVVRVKDQRYAIPQINLEELVTLYDDDVYSKIECAANQEVYRLRETLLPMVRMEEILARSQRFTEQTRSEITRKFRRQPVMDSIPQKCSQLTFAVVKIGTKRFGLIVDKVLGTEEVVVKPMHPSLKRLAIYSGATVMGDGKVALILDIEGIAAHGDIRFSSLQDGLDDEKALRRSVDENLQPALLFRSGETEQFAVPLPMIRRIERIALSDLEKIGSREFVTINGVSTRVLRLENALNVSPCKEKKEMFLLLPKYIKKPFGVLMSEVADIVLTPMVLNQDSYMEEGLLGTAIINKHITLFLELYRLIEKTEPDWFGDHRKRTSSCNRKMRIVFAEDTPFFRQLIKGYLEADDNDILIAENGKQALELLNDQKGEEPVDLIISDIEMPQMNGLELIKNIRMDSRLSHIPAIALTALDSDADRDIALESGFDSFQVKIDRESLLSEIVELTKGTEFRDAV